MKILFLGTPAFAVPSLEKLLKSGHTVAGVVTQPDRPRGRCRTPQPPPVKELALSKSLPVFQPQRLSDPEFLAGIRKLEATGLMAQILQHETDHLQGHLYVERLSYWKRKRLLHKYQGLAV